MEKKKANDGDLAKKRVRHFLADNDIPFRTAERECGLTRGYFGTGGAMGSDKLAMIKQRYPDIDLEYVITGKHAGQVEARFRELYENASRQIETLNKIISSQK